MGASRLCRARQCGNGRGGPRWHGSWEPADSWQAAQVRAWHRNRRGRREAAEAAEALHATRQLCSATMACQTWA